MVTLPPRAAKISSADFSRYVLIAVAVVGTTFLAWRLVDVFLLAFGGAVFAAVLRALANLLSRGTKLSVKWSLGGVIVLLIVVLGSLLWLFGGQLEQQTEQLQTQLPQAIDTLKDRITEWSGGRLNLEMLKAPGGSSGFLGHFAKIATLAAGFIGHFVVIMFVGLYLSFDPDLYVRCVVRLFPVDRRPQIRDALELSGTTLRKWLVGKLGAMALMGVLTGVGLALVHVPLALALGVLAGILEFIPVVGPVLAIVPGVLLALSHSPQTAVYALIIYTAVLQLENHVIVPLTQRWSVALPPAVALLSLVAMGLLFGILGVLFAMPLTVVIVVLLKKLYVEDGLEKPAAATDL